jgi:hypothetical protein
LKDNIGSCDNNMFANVFDEDLKKQLKKSYNSIIIPLNFKKVVDEKTRKASTVG